MSHIERAVLGITLGLTLINFIRVTEILEILQRTHNP